MPPTHSTWTVAVTSGGSSPFTPAPHQSGLQAEVKLSFWTLPSSPNSSQITSPHKLPSHICSLLSVGECAKVFPIMSSVTVTLSLPGKLFFGLRSQLHYHCLKETFPFSQFSSDPYISSIAPCFFQRTGDLQSHICFVSLTRL